MIEYKGEKGCQTGVCAAECVDWEDNGKRQNECRGNEKGRWNEWDRQCRRGKKKKDRWSFRGLSHTDKTQTNWVTTLRLGTEISQPWVTETEKTRHGPLILTSPCGSLLFFAASLPRFHWALQWFFPIPKNQKEKREGSWCGMMSP